MRLAPFFPALLMLSTVGVSAQDKPSAPALRPLDGFEREVLGALQASHTERRSVVLHVAGGTVSGIVTGIGPDVVALANREHARILVRRERIDAVEAD
jgi:hypothetical protein